ncbi:MAG TPA: DUF6391 domain-containing protein [Caldilineaceae bacterium]|nr:DUF6391 domain-containing protein [Caldilineaceae bacterium]
MYAQIADLVRRTRQHHAIEHATIHMLTRRNPQERFSGHSDPAGFTIYGAVEEADLRRAVGDALLRLQAGEHQLAIHPNCGTNLATSALLVTLASLVAGSGRGSFLQRFSAVLLLVLPALIVAKPLGYRLQQYTTLAEVGDRWVADIRPVHLGKVQVYRVLFD